MPRNLLAIPAALLAILLVSAASAQVPCDCNGDIDGDGHISFADLAILQQCLLAQPPPPYTMEDCDLNCDGFVTSCDLDVWNCQFIAGFPDPECCVTVICGACCLQNGTVCTIVQPQDCAGAGGEYAGDGTLCPAVNAGIFNEPGGEVFVHVVGPPVKCDEDSLLSQYPSDHPIFDPPYFDPWISNEDDLMCHNFGVPGSPPLPADFFEPGSEPFEGAVCLRGEPLGHPDFGDADTIIERQVDPFDRCELPDPAAPRAIDIEIVALSLVSIEPIEVMTFGTPVLWDVAVDLSVVPQPVGQLNATKTHCNGGTYTSFLPVQPRFTFIRVEPPHDMRELDTGIEGIPPVPLDQFEPMEWASDVGVMVGNVDQGSDFHAGFLTEHPILDCDCNLNNQRDLCDIENGLELDCQPNAVPDSCDIANGTSLDENSNGIPDECEGATGVAEALAPTVVLPVHLGATPNPVASSITFDYSLPVAGRASLIVYQVNGRRVATLLNEERPAGEHAVVWNGCNERGKRMPAGVYYVKLMTRNGAATSKFIIIR